MRILEKRELDLHVKRVEIFIVVFDLQVKCVTVYTLLGLDLFSVTWLHLEPVGGTSISRSRDL